MKKLLLIAFVLAMPSMFAYVINIANNTDYELAMTPKFAATSSKYEWRVLPKSQFRNQTSGYCTQSIKIEAKDPSNPSKVIKAVEFKPKSTGLGMRCAGFNAIVSAIPGSNDIRVDAQY